MAFVDYNDYVVSLATFLVIPSTDGNFQIALPRIIDDAEQRIYRELDILNTVTVDQGGNLTANSRSFTLPQTNGRFVVTESMNVFSTFGATATGRQALTPTTREYIDYTYGNETAPGSPSVPEYYAMITDQTIIVGPSPDQNYQMEVIGTIRPTPLSATNTQTYLTLYLPDLFFAESCLIGYGYMKDFGAAVDDPQGSVTWAAHYKDLWQSANAEEQRKRYASMAWSSKQPSPIATPPRA